ncbi:MAG: hypothetical protein ACO3TQ_04335, partial [Burkholderiaceae bacterium]
MQKTLTTLVAITARPSSASIVGADPWRSLKRLLLAFVGLLALGLQPLGAEGLPTLDKTLANGMRIVVFEDSRSPTALHMVWIRAGSMDETDGKSGIAH